VPRLDRVTLNLTIKLRSRATSLVLLLFLSGLSLCVVGCGDSGTPAGAVVGRAGKYDYSPSVIQSGDVQQFWWCGQARNPSDPDQDTDAILYEAINISTHTSSQPVVALAESPGGWDSAYTCNPKVVQGTFVNPLGDGRTYTYAMYYVGTASIEGVSNSIGVAFSVDGASWNKYPNPVIMSANAGGYGAAQPAVYNSDQKAGIWVFYEDNVPTMHIGTTSTDGVHFTVQGTLTLNGLDPDNPQPTWGDMARDASTKTWYAVYNLPSRPPSTTGAQLESGQIGVQLFRIAEGSLFSGATPWQQLKTIDTNSTGNECNFIPGFLRDPYGDVHVGAYPTLQIFTSISNPKPAWDDSPAEAGSSCRPETWDIGTATWSPSESTVALNSYYNDTVHEVTTGWIDPTGGFILQFTIGHLYLAPTNGAKVPFYACKTGNTDYFVSLDRMCEGARIIGLNGYGYSDPAAAADLVPLFRCHSGQDHYIDKTSRCAGAKLEQFLGYALP
jgi:hypothetical protein